MSMIFTVLASGSGGNSTCLRATDFGVLIDVGLNPKQLQERLEAVGLEWADINAVLLTHTHSDHWYDGTLSRLAEMNIPLYTHFEHQQTLKASSTAFATLSAKGLIFAYEPGTCLQLSPTLSCLPFLVRHDSGATCGFRFDGPRDIFGEPTCAGYVADLGSWDETIANHLTNVELLAVEFNHDEDLQRGSSRSRKIIARNLGNAGHLSNDQAVGLIRRVLELSDPHRLQHVVQLHLSEECNRIPLAHGSMNEILANEPQLQLHTALQNKPLDSIVMTDGTKKSKPRKKKQKSHHSTTEPTEVYSQPMLPWEDESAG
ncbi:MAG: MBL fold metallo-hydrolase [Gemmataceae bacterium]